MMSELPETLFLNPVWHALHGPHRRLAVIEGCACRYPSNVSPFAAISSPAGRAFDNLRSLLALGEAVWIVDCGQLMPGLTVIDSLECLQMVLPEDVELPAPSENILPLTAKNAHEMVALTDIAFRLQLDGYPELSGICTHPSHRGKGLARDVIGHLVRRHRRDGLLSWLHVGTSNARAIELYTAMGFKCVRTLMLQRIERTD
jgi:GNAT superfamily N-acetyltransferase